MPPDPVEQLASGVQIRLADGSILKHRALTISEVRRLMKPWQAAIQRVDRQAPAEEQLKQASEKGKALQELLELCEQIAPDLAERLAPGDLLSVLADFFWSQSGAEVVAPQDPAQAPPAPPAATSGPSSSETSPPPSGGSPA